MITEAELRRIASAWAIDPTVVDLDYALGCFLSQWYRIEAAHTLRFKGGTCLRKAYFGDYRFSEDLDFTAEESITQETVQELITWTIRQAQDVFGLNFSERPPRFEVVSDDYGKEIYQARLYYRGPLRWRGDPRAIRVDISSDEHLAYPGEYRGIIHLYSDRDDVAGVKIPCYSLAEMLSEKLRALCGQRRYAIARDLYDTFQLVKRGGVAIADVISTLPGKFAVKGLDLVAIDIESVELRREEFERDWSRNLRHLLPVSDEISFEEAWDNFLDMVHQMGGAS